jgi:hypothetical protein
MPEVNDNSRGDGEQSWEMYDCCKETRCETPPMCDNGMICCVSGVDGPSCDLEQQCKHSHTCCSGGAAVSVVTCISNQAVVAQLLAERW